MTPTDNKTKLVKIYCYVCEMYEKELKYLCQRFSNNNNPEFTDQEVMTIYLYSTHIDYAMQNTTNQRIRTGSLTFLTHPNRLAILLVLGAQICSISLPAQKRKTP